MIYDDQTYGHETWAGSLRALRAVRRRFLNDNNELHLHKFWIWISDANRQQVLESNGNVLVIDYEKPDGMKPEYYRESAKVLAGYLRLIQPDTRIVFYGIPRNWNETSKLTEWTKRAVENQGGKPAEYWLERKYAAIKDKYHEWVDGLDWYKPIATEYDSTACSLYCWTNGLYQCDRFAEESLNVYAAKFGSLSPYIAPAKRGREDDPIGRDEFRAVLLNAITHPASEFVFIFRAANFSNVGDWLKIVKEYIGV